jgi:hypothetical protein
MFGAIESAHVAAGHPPKGDIAPGDVIRCLKASKHEHEVLGPGEPTLRHVLMRYIEVDSRVELLPHYAERIVDTWRRRALWRELTRCASQARLGLSRSVDILRQANALLVDIERDEEQP